MIPRVPNTTWVVKPFTNAREGGGGGGGHSSKFHTGRLRPEVQTLTLSRNLSRLRYAGHSRGLYFLFTFICTPTSDDLTNLLSRSRNNLRQSRVDLKQISRRSKANLPLLYSCTQLYYFVYATSIFPTITSTVKSRTCNTVMHLNLVIISQSHVSFPYLATLPACPYISFLSKLTMDFVYNCVISCH